VGNAVARRNEPIQPMTLGNMRRNGVRGLFVTCTACGRTSEVNINVDAWPVRPRKIAPAS